MTGETTGLRVNLVGVRFFQECVQKTPVFLTGIIRDFLSGKFDEKRKGFLNSKNGGSHALFDLYQSFYNNS